MKCCSYDSSMDGRTGQTRSSRCCFGLARARRLAELVRLSSWRHLNLSTWDAASLQLWRDGDRFSEALHDYVL